MIRVNICLDFGRKSKYVKKVSNLSSIINFIMRFLVFSRKILLKFFLSIMIKKEKFTKNSNLINYSVVKKLVFLGNFELILIILICSLKN